MKKNIDLSETAKAVLGKLEKSPLGTDAHGKFITLDLLEYYFGEEEMEQVEAAIRELVDHRFIKLVEDEESVWKLTPYGEEFSNNYSGGANTIFSNIKNSAIAHQSSGATQTINIHELPQDLQEKIAELEDAVRQKNAGKIKSTFGYIADKSVDTAISLLTGSVLSG